MGVLKQFNPEAAPGNQTTDRQGYMGRDTMVEISSTVKRMPRAGLKGHRRF